MGLLDSSDESENEIEQVDLKVNKKFADKFEKEQRYKELQRSKELLKNGIVDDSEDSESESEDEDAEQLSTALDLKIIQTINSIRKKDPRIYDKSTEWFEKPAEESEDDEEDEGKSSKKKKYKDVLREQLLTHGADIEGENAKHSKKVHESNSKNKLSYNQEQEAVRQEFLKAAGGDNKKATKKKAENSDDESDDEVLAVKPKTPLQLLQEEVELKAALKEMKALGEKEGSMRVISKSTAIMSSSLDPSEDPEEFLNNYLMNQKWKDKSDKSLSVGRKKRNDSSSEGEDDMSDEEELDKVDRFESKYNFRFEELQAEGSASGAVQVTGHARDVAGSMRRVDDKRKQQREQRQERKEKEKRKQEAELRRLKNLKRQELKERLNKIGEIAGLKKLGLDENLLDEDWDPNQHEAMMNAQFNDEYYNEEDDTFHYPEGGAGIEGDGGDYTTQELLALEGYDEYEGGEGGEGEYPEEGEAYGEDYPEGELDEEEAAQVKQMVNELYQLDYEDIVAGIPCRFKYKEVEPEGFGLTAEEILLADDSELNKFVSLKHISAYNTKGYRKSDQEISKKRKKLRSAVKERLAREALEAEILGKELKGTKKNAKKATGEMEVEEDQAEGAEEAAEEQAEGAAAEGEGKKKRKRRKAKQPALDDVSSNGAAALQSEPKKARTSEESTSGTAGAAAASSSAVPISTPTAASNGVVKVGTNKERKLKVLEAKKKHRQKLIEQSKEKAAVKKAMKSAESNAHGAAVSGAGKNGASESVKKRLDLYK